MTMGCPDNSHQLHKEVFKEGQTIEIRSLGKLCRAILRASKNHCGLSLASFSSLKAVIIDEACHDQEKQVRRGAGYYITDLVKKW